MVQIQSSWFPLYDRNPQKFVENIFYAKPEDYSKARQRVYHTPQQASFIDFPIAPCVTGRQTELWDRYVEKLKAHQAL